MCQLTAWLELPYISKSLSNLPSITALHLCPDVQSFSLFILLPYTACKGCGKGSPLHVSGLSKLVTSGETNKSLLSLDKPPTTMPLFVPILRLLMLFLNIYDSYKTLKDPVSSSRNGGRPTVRAISQRKRDIKGCLAVWVVWVKFKGIFELGPLLNDI